MDPVEVLVEVEVEVEFVALSGIAMESVVMFVIGL